MKSSNTFVRKPLVAAISGVLASASPVAMAQDDAGADTIEEILVTASRREQRIEDIPYNISAVDGQAIEDQNVIDTAELMRSISGVSVIDRGFRNAGHVNSLVIRGVNVDNGANGDYGLSAAATVATYVDNTPLFANFLLKDIQRVEVLRGPQGTLYGSSALGGTVRYIMNRPGMATTWPSMAWSIFRSVTRRLSACRRALCKMMALSTTSIFTRSRTVSRLSRTTLAIASASMTHH
jgi:outer membrane cobalamin receptor